MNHNLWLSLTPPYKQVLVIAYYASHCGIGSPSNKIHILDRVYYGEEWTRDHYRKEPATWATPSTTWRKVMKTTIVANLSVVSSLYREK